MRVAKVKNMKILENELEKNVDIIAEPKVKEQVLNNKKAKLEKEEMEKQNVLAFRAKKAKAAKALEGAMDLD